MESTDSPLAVASHSGNPQMPLSNRLHVRVSVLGNEFELTDERVDGKKEPVNIQELVSAFIGVLKSTSPTVPATSQLVIENDKNQATSSKNQELNAEITRLKYLVRKSEGENEHLQQRLQESKKENEQLKIRFRSATHMKAAEVAQRLSRVNIEQNAHNGGGHKSLTCLEESCTPEQIPQDFILNPQVKEIDFLSLDDLLGNDDVVDINFKRTDKNLTEGEDNAAVENSGFESRPISGDDEKNLDSSRAETFALSHSTPPSVLKIGLNPDIARAGGKCIVENSQRSPMRRSPRRRERFNNHDSNTERENIIETDEERAGRKDLSMVDIYGIMHKPFPNDGSCYKTVSIGNLPQDIDYHQLLAKVRGGPIISATLCDTTKLRGCWGRKSALVVFLEADAARAYVQFVRKYEICFSSQRAFVQLVETPTYPLADPAKKRIFNGQTRHLVISKFNSELSLSKIDRVINIGVNEYRAHAIDRFWKDENGNVRICFASINAAGMAYWRLQNDQNHNRLEIEFDKDPCGRPLSDLLPNPTGRRVSDFVNMKVNYDDEEDSDNGNTRDVGQVSPPTNPNANNMEEIVIEDNDDSTVDDKVTEGEVANDQIVKEEWTTAVISVVTMVDEVTTIDCSTISLEAKRAEMVEVAKETPPIIDHSREAQEPKTTGIPNAETSPSNSDSATPHNMLHLEETPIIRDITILESATFSPKNPQVSGPISSMQSNIADISFDAVSGALESWADDVIEAVEAGTLKPPMELKFVFPRALLIDTEEEPANPVSNILTTIAEEDPLMFEPEEGPFTEVFAETPVAGFTITERPATHTPVFMGLTVPTSSAEQLATALDVINKSSEKFLPVEAIEKSVAELPNPVPTVALVPGPVSLAPHNSPQTGPFASVPGRLWVNPEISHETPIQDELVRMQNKPSIQNSKLYTTMENERTLVLKRNLKPYTDIPTSRYAGLGSMAARPRSSLREFYKAVDFQSIAPTPPNLAVPIATDPQSAIPSPSKPDPETPSPDQRSCSCDEVAMESEMESLESRVAPQIHITAAITA